MSDRTRHRVFYSGYVQGVGFRATSCGIARRFHVQGTVRNLADGGVELVVEGSSTEVERFLQAISDEMGDKIHDERREILEPSEPFPDFRIIY